MPYVRVKPDRDEYGFGIYAVAERNEKTKEVRLTHHDKRVPQKGFWLFEAHTLTNDRQVIKMNAEERQAKIAKTQAIGICKR